MPSFELSSFQHWPVDMPSPSPSPYMPFPRFMLYFTGAYKPSLYLLLRPRFPN
jgi:hypothetical protein